MANEVLTAVKSLTGKAEKIGESVSSLNGRVETIEKALAKPDFYAGRIPAQPIDHREAGKHGFNTPKDFLIAVMKAERGMGEDSRLKSLKITKSAGADEQMGANDAYGGYLVPITYSPDFLKVDPEADPIGSATRKVPMATPIVKIPARTDKNHTTSVAGGLKIYRREEAVDATASRMQVEQLSLEAHNLMGVAYATEEIMMDSPTTFTSLISDGFNDQFTYHMIDERLNGDGVGKYLGIMNSPALVSVNKETNQAAATIVYENILKMRARCWMYAKAFWLANHDCLPQLMLLNQAVGTGGAVVWQPSAREDHPDTLLGRPLYFTEYTKTLGTTGDVVLCNWNEYLEGIYQPMQSAESVHVRFVQHERAFKFFMRNAGLPWWKTALTPKNSSATLSPYVVLQTRS